MSEKRKSIPAGSAMIRLNDMAAALSFKPTLLICLKKKVTTSYSGNPRKPGIINALLFRDRKDTGADRIIVRCSLFKAWVRFVFSGPYNYPVLFDILWHIDYVLQNYC